MKEHLIWILLPIIGACIGYATNFVAIKMLFHPRKKKFGIQGLIPRRQNEMAESIGEIVGEELLNSNEMFNDLKDIDPSEWVADFLDKVIDEKIKDFQSIPLLGSLISKDSLSGVKDSLLKEVSKNKEVIMEKVIATASEKIDTKKITTEKLSNFNLERLEAMINKVAATEFKAIEIWGAVLGFIIGIVQATITQVL